MTTDVAIREPDNMPATQPTETRVVQPRTAPAPITQPELDLIMTIAETQARAQLIRVQKQTNDRAREFNFEQTRAEFAVLMLYGRDAGLGPTESISSLYSVHGNIAWRGHAYAKAIKSHPDYDFEVITETGKETVRCDIKAYWMRRDGTWGSAVNTVTMEDIVKMGINVTKADSMYKKHPKSMLFNRCIAQVGRMYCAGAFSYSPPYIEGELEEIGTNEAQVVIPAATAPANGSTPQLQGDTPKLTEGTPQVEQPKPRPKVDIESLIAELAVAEENSRGDLCPMHKSMFGPENEHDYITDENTMDVCKLEDAVSFVSKRFYQAIKHYHPDDYLTVGKSVVAEDGVWTRSVTIHDKTLMAFDYAKTGSWEADEPDLQDLAAEFNAEEEADENV